MTEEESRKVMFTALSAYSKYMSSVGKSAIEYMERAWFLVMKEYQFSEAMMGVQIFLSQDTKGFPPSPGQIVDCIARINETAADGMSESEAWNLVCIALRNSLYHAQEEYDKLPPLVQKAVGTADNLKELAQMDSQLVHSGGQTRFVNAYKTVVMRSREDRKIPASIMAMINSHQEKLETAEKPMIEDKDEPKADDEQITGMSENTAKKYAELKARLSGEQKID